MKQFLSPHLVKFSPITLEDAQFVMKKESGFHAAPSLRPAKGEDLTIQELQHLSEALERIHVSVTEFFLMVGRKDLELYWFEGDESRVLVALMPKRAQQELLIYMISGHGWLYHFEEIWPLMQNKAREMGLKYVGGLVRSFGLRRAYEKFGATAYAVYYRKGV